MVGVKLSKEGCKNAADMIEIYFFVNIKAVGPYDFRHIRRIIKFCNKSRSATEY